LPPRRPPRNADAPLRSMLCPTTDDGRSRSFAGTRLRSDRDQRAARGPVWPEVRVHCCAARSSAVAPARRDQCAPVRAARDDQRRGPEKPEYESENVTSEVRRSGLKTPNVCAVSRPRSQPSSSTVVSRRVIFLAMIVRGGQNTRRSRLIAVSATRSNCSAVCAPARRRPYAGATMTRRRTTWSPLAPRARSRRARAPRAPRSGRSTSHRKDWRRRDLRISGTGVDSRR